MNNLHTPIMVNEVIELLNVQKHKKYLDMTFGFGGHTKKILKKLNNTGLVISFDINEKSIEIGKKMEKNNSNFIFNPISYVNYTLIKNNKFDGIFLDLGFSSFNLENNRGFSYLKNEEPLDMRYSLKNSKTAKNILYSLSANSLKNKLKKYDVIQVDKLVTNIKHSKKENNLNKVGDLNQVIKITYGKKLFHKMQKIIFQALRIIVNDELNNLNLVLNTFPTYLNNNGTLVILTFHSIELEIVLKKFRKLINPHPPKLPININKEYELITKQPITPSEKEISTNSRAKSAKLVAIRRK